MVSLSPDTQVPRPRYIMLATAAAGCLGLVLIMFLYYPGMPGYFLLAAALSQAIPAIRQYRDHRSGMQLSRHGNDVECRFTPSQDRTYYLAVDGNWAAECTSSPVMLRNVPEGARISLATQNKNELVLISEGRAGY